MRFLFVVQGEGRGHLTQAIALAERLRRNGHQISEVLVGKNFMRQIPEWFFNRIGTCVQTYPSPNFLKTTDNKRFRIVKSFGYNLQKYRRKAYFASMRLIRNRIADVKPDMVINFYELLCGLAYRKYRIQVPMACVAHQFVFEHPDYKLPRLTLTQRMLRLYTKWSSLGAQKRLALSLSPMDDRFNNGLYVVPPLLRSDLTYLRRETKPFLLGYILNYGFAEEIIAWHHRNSHIALHVFWDKPDVPNEFVYDSNLVFHRLDDKLFLQMLASCTAFFGTAGFESVCEALYLGKPMLIVPAHDEQKLNAIDASSMSSVIVSGTFNLDPLLAVVGQNVFSYSFETWAQQAENMILKALMI